VLVIANAHHDPANVDALRAAVASAAKYSPGLIIFPDLTRRRWAEKLTAEFRAGCHAGRYEGSVVLAEEPGTVRTEIMASLPPNPRSLVDAVRAGHHTLADAGGPEAYFGMPAEATADEGRAIIDMLGGIIEEAVLDAVQAGSISPP
jgi:creatinine amidohydrolase